MSLSLTPVANLPPVWTTPVELVAKFAAGVVDTGGKFAIGVDDTGGAPWLANISANFWKNMKWPSCYFQGLGRRWFMKKIWSKNLVTLSVFLASFVTAVVKFSNQLQVIILLAVFTECIPNSTECVPNFTERILTYCNWMRPKLHWMYPKFYWMYSKINKMYPKQSCN